MTQGLSWTSPLTGLGTTVIYSLSFVKTLEQLTHMMLIKVPFCVRVALL